jgi:hypothetical protein
MDGKREGRMRRSGEGVRCDDGERIGRAKETNQFLVCCNFRIREKERTSRANGSRLSSKSVLFW